MDPKYDHTTVESRIYQMWEEGEHFTPKIDPQKKPFTIILPLPNASDPMHMGHALFTVEDILVRYHRMLGEPTLWLPGGDHAGIETQYIFEKHLAKQDKSRFDFDRQTLYQMIWDFTQQNKDLNKQQMKQLGFSLDWTRYHYSLEPEIVTKVLDTFRKLHADGLIYRGERIVNFCTHCGTAFSELEVDYIEKQDSLYYLDYDSIQIATARPETIFADVAVAVNPKDKRYKDFLSKKAVIPLINVDIPIITAPEIEMAFGTGALKVTPGYDPLDFEIGQREKLETFVIIDRRGKMIADKRVPQELVGLNVKQARTKTIELLKAAGKLVKEDPLTHSVGTCYRCGTTIEPMVIPQWFVKIQSLAKPAIKAVKEGKTKIFPKKRFERLYFDWMAKIKDWNISRQIVWGPRIPAWYKINGHEQRIWTSFIDAGKKFHQGTIDQHLREGFSLEDIKKGLQQVSVPVYQESANQPNIHIGEKAPDQGNWIQETDTFDTWFLSGQWPVNTLKLKPSDFEYFYPTSVLDTLWDILFFWVARMMMLGIYLTGKVPFETVHIHARVVDAKGQKMSKSKGNVINPIEMVDKYGADALRMALVIGVAPASDIVISDDKVRAMRNFANKVWNISRFIKMSTENKEIKNFGSLMPKINTKDSPKELVWCYTLFDEVNKLSKEVTNDLENFKFGRASEKLYEYTWHKFADVDLEISKKFLEGEYAPYIRDVLLHIEETLLKLLHPFMPFITEEIWGLLGNKTPLIISPWPTTK